MPKLNFRRFKYVALYAGAIIVIITFLYWLLELAGVVQWTSENRTALGRLWGVLTSREGVVIWTGLIAVFLLATILVEWRVDADRDVKWKRRKARLDNKKGRLESGKVLTEGQVRNLVALRKKGYELHQACMSGRDQPIKDQIEKWEKDTAQTLRVILGDEPADRFLHEPTTPVHIGGYPNATAHAVGRMKVRMEVLNSLIKSHSA